MTFQPEKIPSSKKNTENLSSYTDKLVTGEMSLQTFQEKWLQFDQEGNHTERAGENIQALENEKIKEFIQKQSEEIQKHYFQMLATSYFHRAQKNLSLEDFQKAHQYAVESGDKEFSAYIQGTVHFLKENKLELRKEIEKIKNPELQENRGILMRFYEALEKDENPEEVYYQYYFKK